jgi:hypothetical protein
MKIVRKSWQVKHLAALLTVRSALASLAGEWGVFEPQRLPSDPIDLDRSRNLPISTTARKPAPMLDLIKMTVSLTVSSGLPSKNARRNKDLAAQLMTEWE